MKRILGNRVLIEQIMTKKESNLILTAKQKEDTENFEIERKVIMVGLGVNKEEIEVGDIPVFGKYAVEDSIKIVSKTDDVLVAHLVMNVDNIVGIDNLEIK